MEAINKGRMAGKKCKMKERQEGRPGVGRNKGKLGKGMMIEGMNEGRRRRKERRYKEVKNEINAKRIQVRKERS